MAASKGRQRQRSKSRKEQLLKIAAEIFVDEGYKETGIDKMLKQAGLTGPALYRHFSSKQEILDTICLDEARHTLEMVREARDEINSSPLTGLRNLLKKRIERAFSSHGYASMLALNQRIHLSAEAREKLIEMQREYRDFVVKTLQKANPNANEIQLKIAFFAAQNMLFYTIWRSKDRSMVSQERLKEILESMIWKTIFLNDPVAEADFATLSD